MSTFMRQSFFALLLSLLVLSCATEPTVQPQTGLEGRWLWIESSGGFTGSTQKPEPGYSLIYEFSSDGSFKSYANGEPSNSLNYVLVKAPDGPDSNMVDLIRFSGVQTLTKRFQIVNVDTLQLDDWDMSEGYTSIYTRVR
jgi:hypothetical protein